MTKDKRSIADAKITLHGLDRLQASQFGNQLYSFYLYKRNGGEHFPVQYGNWPINPAPVPRDDFVDPAQDQLKKAFDVFLQRQVYNRIHNDNLEPIVDLEPESGQFGDLLAEKVHRMLATMATAPAKDAGGYNWRDLGIVDRAVISRMERLLPDWPLRGARDESGNEHEDEGEGEVDGDTEGEASDEGDG